MIGSRCALAFVAMAMVASIAAAQDATIVIDKNKGSGKLKLEVRDFGYIETVRTPLEGNESCEDVLARDLTFSDFFNVGRESGYIPSPGDSSGVRRDVFAVVTGEVRREWGKVVLKAEVIQAATGRPIFRKSYPLGSPPARAAIHAYADDIVYYLTGESGVAQTRIAFIGHDGGHKDIWIVDYDGSNVHQLTHLDQIAISPAWSPRGDKLAFTSYMNNRPDLVSYRLSDGKVTTLSARPGINSAPSYSPKGGRLAASLSFEGNAEIYLLDENGAQAQRLTLVPSIETSPTWSPSGDRIAFTSDRSGEPHVYIMDTDGANVRRLTFTGKWCDSPDWSPKGDNIIFVSLIDDVFDICRVRPDGSGLVRITANSGSWENPRWAPDGLHLVAARRDSKGRKLYVMASDGSGKRALTSWKGDQYNPAWSPPLRVTDDR